MLSALPGKFVRRMEQLREYREWVSLVEAKTGKGAATQLREIRAMKQYGGRCGISDYYWYRLYDESYMMGRGAPDYLGWRLQQQFSLALNPRNAALPAWDKVAFSVLAGESGLPLAPIRACFHPARRISSVLGIHLRTRDEVAEWLRDTSLYPMFAKPSYSQQGYGSLYMAAFDPASNSITLLNGKSMPVDEFLQRLDTSVDRRFHKPECGFLFQEAFRPAVEIQALTDWIAVCGVRVICLNGPDGVHPIRSFWKIAVPPNHLDNFSMGRYGNLLADADISTGEIRRVLNGFWPKTAELSAHPLTGKPFAGFRLPGWSAVMDACACGGSVFPLQKIQHWDFALTERGPLILELNDIGSTQAAQIHGHGLLTQATRDFLKEHGDSHAHPWIRDL